MFLALCSVFFMKTLLVSSQCDQRAYGGIMMCCAGRNSNCYVRMPKSKGKGRTVCYCDEYCKMTGDCCADFDKIKSSCRGKNSFYL